MDNAKLIVYVLLATATLSTAAHRTRTSAPNHHLVAFMASKGSRSQVMHAYRPMGKLRASSEPIYTVTATAYQAVAEQTDDEPFVTADNSRIKPHYSSRIRWMALSQDLLERWGGKFKYGDKVLVRGLSPQLDGVYTVHDTMNKRHRHCMDVLTHPSERVDIFTEGVRIQLAAMPALRTRSSKQKRPYALASPVLSSSTRLARQRAPRATAGRKEMPYYFASAIL